MGFFDDLFSQDIIWVVLLLLLVFLLPQKSSESIFKNKIKKDEDTKCKEDIILTNTKSKRERRRLVY